MSVPPPSKIIAKVAIEILKPIGVFRKGQSRTWIDDHGWRVSIIEFQPGRGRGTYLNVGVNWQWYPKDYFSFDLGYREEPFHEYRSDEQFTPYAYKLVNKAKNKIVEYRNALSTIVSAKEYILKYNFSRSDDIWVNYHKGVLCGLSQSIDECSYYFSKVTNNPDDREWAQELKKHVSDLIDIMPDPSKLKNLITENIIKSRVSKKLDKKMTIKYT